MATREPPKRPPRHTRPTWLRVLLMILLILTVAVAFYLNNLDILRYFNQ